MIKLYLGPGWIVRQDLIFSPFVHKDVSFLNAGLEYTRTGDLFHDVKVRYASYTPELVPSYEYIEDGEEKIASPHNFTFVDLDYLIGKEIISGKSSIIAGGAIMADIQAVNYVYGRISNFGYHATIGVGAFGKYDHSLSNKSRLSITIKLPVISWYARSPWMVNDDAFIENISSHSGFKTFMSFLGDGKPATWNKLQYFDLEVSYNYDLSMAWGIGAAYSFDYLHAAEPRSLLSFRNSVFMSVYAKF